MRVQRKELDGNQNAHNLRLMKVTRGSEALKDHVRERQVEMAGLIGKALGRTISQGTISSWATGRNMPGGDALVAILSVCGIPLTWWLEAPEADKATGT